MKPIRSMLFIPANKRDWILKAKKYQADALILDLEDAVPPNQKQEARQIIKECFSTLKEQNQCVYVRINDLETDLYNADLEAITDEHLDGVVIPKADSVEQIKKVDTILSFLEERRGLQQGKIEIIPLLETAAGIRDCYDICKASNRVKAVFAGNAKGGDIQRNVGFVWTKEGTETLYLRSKRVLDIRAAGLKGVIGGVWTEIDDFEGFREDALFSKQLGFTGCMTIYPTHVPVLNEIFSPSREEIEFSQGIIEAMKKAEAEGTSAVRYRDTFIDIAHLKTAQEVVERARIFGMI
ncbi:CoA ester lyase [Bacillus sp. OK048]|uniref:HpcH/HpaI aldolase/citrate lyase family protein n=1 Tax=Bacillus sp. OK048 TaxID=1882761 RepID=UPI00088B50CF|nr:CoA ester lyase [Bacillus sp. OK048]SDL96368.1 citrate lyase subunit beta / citryl-CoA lyase [Bacillus sp. OK048]